MKNSLEELESLLGYTFNNKGYLQEALIHSSYSYEKNLKCSNERFELLGDAVIHLVITEYLINKYQSSDEGVLSALRSYCESEPFLYERALDVQLGRFIQLGKGEAQSGGQYKESVLSDAYEALIAAVHLDGGYKKSKKVVLEQFTEYIINAHDDKLFIDSKSELQKLSQKNHGSLPLYVLDKEEGAEHEKIFFVTVSIESENGDLEASGIGRSKKAAEKDAARKLLKKISTSEK